MGDSLRVERYSSHLGLDAFDTSQLHGSQTTHRKPKIAHMDCRRLRETAAAIVISPESVAEFGLISETDLFSMNPA